MVFQGASYFDYCQTNLALDVPQPPYGTLREQLVISGRIEPLESSQLINVAGINALIFTSDGFMVFQKRYNTVLIRPGELCSGFSGTIDKIDIVNLLKSKFGGTLSELDAIREGVEELGIKRGEESAPVLLGITRELIRGGDPEIFYSFDIDITFSELKKRVPKDKEGLIRGVNFETFGGTHLPEGTSKRLAPNFPRLLNKIQEEGEGPLSIPLVTNLVLWLRKHCPEQVGVEVMG